MSWLTLVVVKFGKIKMGCFISVLRSLQVNRSTRKDDSSLQRSAIKNEPVSPTSPLHSSTPTAPPIALHITSKSDLPEPVSLLDPAEEIVQVVEKPRPKFILSTMSQQEKIDYAALIEDLGGVVFDNQFFNPSSRLTIAGQLNRFVILK